VAQSTITVTGTIADLFTSAKMAAKTTAAASPDFTVTFTVNNSAPQSAILAGTTYSFTVNLGDGINTIQISAANNIGKSAQSKRTVSYKPTFSPTVTDPVFSLAITEPAADVRTVQNSYVLAGTISNNTAPVTISVSVNGTTYSPDVVNGTFQQRLTLSEAGVYQVTVTGLDQNGNTLSVQRNIIHSIPTVDSGTGSATASPFTIVDALLSLMMAVGNISPTSDQALRMDVAPMVNGVSVGDGRIDVEDTLVILYMAVGLIQ
jgi:hypothetical protein